ncbi:hypothetical protein, unlikely [Trypanosoma brucei gambiense DAL972]|uniref:Uncharacterized protein n=1 Tax=Trypanosoma brucei gambiense (strain MHOM/CI/86/DAL972) TaxID=679716 RepID=D0AAS1_TRYB9|nr:hypothetical protein, unlikely [Trypanosoma brucei gambiense DAL972]CBH18772.1 hypothetical protein, unlikely [Trypanosoma brucei gambiense DAL972]|eukprot:XP_011781036.1 hypothetical protein, unlikely [Trypanosoma brucei gambiense DAL972]
MLMLMLMFVFFFLFICSSLSHSLVTSFFFVSPSARRSHSHSHFLFLPAASTSSFFVCVFFKIFLLYCLTSYFGFFPSVCIIFFAHCVFPLFCFTYEILPRHSEKGVHN